MKKSSHVSGSSLPFADLQGHRGCRGLMPENTIQAMIHALELGVTTLEMDAVITADRQVILSHEPFFNHEIATKPNGQPVQREEEKTLNIYAMTYADVRRFDVGKLPHPRFPEQRKIPAVKPLLSEVIDSVKAWCSRHNRPLPFFNIETKCLPEGDLLYHPAPGAFVEHLMEVVQKAGIQEKTILQSFDFRTLRYAHAHYPALALAALVEPDDAGTPEQHLQSLGFTPAVYAPAWQRVDAVLVAFCQTRGMKLIPWTVNDPAEAVRLKNLGVTAVITDYPDRIR